jgi:hypothetical protein
MDELRVKLPFTPGVQVKVQLTSRIPIGAKVEISLESLLGFKTEIGKKKFNLPQGTNKCGTLWPCIGPKAEKGDQQIWGASLQPCGAYVPAFIRNLRPND